MITKTPGRLLLVGDCNPDIVLRGEDLQPRFGQIEQIVEEAALSVGGSAAITACGAARLETPTSLAALVGDDLFGTFQRLSLEKRGVDTTWLHTDDEAGSGLSVILSQGDERAILTYPGTLDRFTASHVSPSAIASAAHVHISSYYLQPALRIGLFELLSAARRAGATTSLDPGWDPSERWDGITELLPLLDVIVPNEQEATRLTDTLDVGEAADRLHAQGTTVVVKRGSEGALVSSNEGRFTMSSPSVEVVDAIGAGDSFAAAFLSWRLRGADLRSSVRAACHAGALSTQSRGGIEAQPGLRELEARLAEGGSP